MLARIMLIAATTTIAAPAMAATTYDFTATFATGPYATITGSYALEGDTLVGLDLTIGSTRYDLTNSASQRGGLYPFFTTFSIYATAGGPGTTTGTDDFALDMIQSFFPTPSPVSYAFMYTFAAEPILVESSSVTVTERVAAGPVPEPASWAMMIGGFALVGGVARRRRAVLAA